MWSKKIFASSALFLAATGILTASAPYMLTVDGRLERSPVVAMMAHSQLTVGDRLASAGSFGAAMDAYGVAAELVRAQGKVPVVELRRIANAQFFAGNFRAAAKTLEQLADEAAVGGELLAEFSATADAAHMALLAGAEGYARWYTIRAERLLDSPGIPAELREEMEAKLVTTDFTVFAPHLSSW
ncbi:MAG: hypothetical protein PVJ64_09835 [Gemmatimonadales bacterium]